MDVRRDIYQKANSDTMHASARLIKVDKVSRARPEDRACGRIPFQDTFKPEQILICSGFLYLSAMKKRVPG